MRLHERNIINIIKQSHSVLQAQLKTQPFDEKIASGGVWTHASGLHDQRAAICATEDLASGAR